MRIKSYLTCILIAIISIAINSCNHSRKSSDSNLKPSEKNISESETSENSVYDYDSIAFKFRLDTCGCNGFRGYNAIMNLINHYELPGKDSISVIEVLGPPNEMDLYDDGTMIWVYVLESIQTDKCFPRKWIYLDFDSLGTLVPHPGGYLSAIS